VYKRIEPPPEGDLRAKRYEGVGDPDKDAPTYADPDKP
jgi:hypothetical protein